MSVLKLSKKGEALFFLMELLLISVIIIIFAGATYSSVTSEGKYLTFDSYNLGLFLERVPSIEGNFQYEFNFKNPVSVEFHKDYILLDKPNATNKRYTVSYLNPLEFQLDRKFNEVEKLYFYKHGDNLEVSDEISKKGELLLFTRDFLKDDTKKLHFVSLSDISKIDSDNIAFFLNENVVTQLSLNSILNNPTNKSLWIHGLDSSESYGDFLIYYNKPGRDLAKEIYNKINIYSMSEGLGLVSIAPMFENNTLMNANMPIVVTKSSDFSKYIAGLRP